MATWINGGTGEEFGNGYDPLGGTGAGSEKARNNAICVYEFFSPLGWTLNAIAGMVGNMQQESTLNPNAQQFPSNPDVGGWGLVQWDPHTELYRVLDYLYGSHADWYDGNKQCAAIYAEYRKVIGEIPASADFYASWRTNATYPLSFYDWAHSTQDAGYLALHFMWSYERPAEDHPERATMARAWYEYLGGQPVPPVPGAKTHGKFWIYLKNRWR